MSWTQRAYGWSTSLLLLAGCATPPPAARPKTAQTQVSPVATDAAADFAVAQVVQATPAVRAATVSELTCTLDKFTVVVDPWVKTYNATVSGCPMDVAEEAQPVASLIVDPPVRFWANVHPTLSNQRATSQAVVDIVLPWDDFAFIFNYD